MTSLRIYLTRISIASILLIAGSGCTTEIPSPTPTPQPTPTILSINLAVELALLRPVIAACAAEIGQSGVLIFEAPSPPLPQDNQTITMRIGYPADFKGFAAQISTEEILIVVPLANKMDDLNEFEVQALFARDTALTTEPNELLEIWIPLSGTQSRALLDSVMDGTAYSNGAFLSPGPVEFTESLPGDPGAIGVLPARWITNEHRSVYSFGEQPVLALTFEKPEGKVRDLLGCLQEQIP